MVSATTTVAIVWVTMAALILLVAAVYVRGRRRPGGRAPWAGIMKGEEETTPGDWYPLRRRVGYASKIAGLAFVGVTAVFLAIAYFTQSIIIEIDSLISFLAAAVLLLSEPRQKVEAAVLDAVLASANETISDFQASTPGTFVYQQKGKGTAGVVATASSAPRPLDVAPPGRALANLYVREAGVPSPTMDSLEASLADTVREDLGLAENLEITRAGDSIKLVLSRPSFECGCTPDDQSIGVLGCTVASFLAVLFCAAANSPVTLSACSRDEAKDTWSVSMTLGKKD